MHRIEDYIGVLGNIGKRRTYAIDIPHTIPSQNDIMGLILLSIEVSQNRLSSFQ
jgi:hypothetical protein